MALYLSQKRRHMISIIIAHLYFLQTHNGKYSTSITLSCQWRQTTLSFQVSAQRSGKILNRYSCVSTHCPAFCHIFCVGTSGMQDSFLKVNLLGNPWFQIVGITEFYSWTSTRENLILLHANNKGADQPAHLCRLICTFVVCSSKI